MRKTDDKFKFTFLFFHKTGVRQIHSTTLNHNMKYRQEASWQKRKKRGVTINYYKSIGRLGSPSLFGTKLLTCKTELWTQMKFFAKLCVYQPVTYIFSELYTNSTWFWAIPLYLCFRLFTLLTIGKFVICVIQVVWVK